MQSQHGKAGYIQATLAAKLLQNERLFCLFKIMQQGIDHHVTDEMDLVF